MAAINLELKNEILALAPKEKDKLLLRLIAKNDILIEQLQFQLVEEGLTIESRRMDVQTEIDKICKKRSITISQLYLEVRASSALITRHVKVTKDKYGEVDLQLNLLFDIFDTKAHYFTLMSRANDKFSYYLAKKTITFLKKLEALDGELKLDFSNKCNIYLNKLHYLSTSAYANSFKITKEFIP